MLKLISVTLLVLSLVGCASHQQVPETSSPQASVSKTDNPGRIPFTGQDIRPYTPMPKSAGMERRLDLKLHELEGQLEDVERKRRELNQLVIESENRYKPLRQDATNSQVQKYQAAQRTYQQKIAQLNAQLEVQTAEIENRLEETLAQLDSHYAYQRAKLQAEHNLKRTQHEVRARTEKAKVIASNGMLGATEAPPVLEGGVAYYDAKGGDAEESGRSTADVQEKNTGERMKATSRPASPPGSSDPDLPEQLAPSFANEENVLVRDGTDMRIKYDAVLVYSEEETRDLWTNFLRAYGETDVFESHNAASGEYFIYVGTFSDVAAAQRRLSDIEETIGTKMKSRIVTRDLTRG